MSYTTINQVEEQSSFNKHEHCFYCTLPHIRVVEHRGGHGFESGAITRSVHLHCIREPNHAQTELFLDMFPANICLRCGPHITEINAEKSGDQSEVPHPSSVFLDRFCPFPRWFRPYADRSGDRRSRETILKIAQSGHGLSLRLSMGDGRSG